MMNEMKRFFALGLVLTMVGGLTGCTVAREERVTERTVVPEEEITVEQPAEEMAEGEQPVARRAMPTGLQDLRSGQPVSYYTQEFERRGYQVQDVDYQTDRVVYDLMRGDQMTRVTLMRPTGQTRVSRVETREVRGLAMERQKTDAAHQKVSQQIEQLQPGKRPEEYIPMVDQLGQVTEYRLRENTAVIEMEANNRHYRINMELDPSRKTVRDIDLDRRVWEIPS